MHRPDDPHVELPRRMRVMGTSGSGKSRLAEQISRRLNVPRLELDAVFWDADWTYRDLADAHALITEFTADNPDGWVIDGNWTSRLDGLLDPGTPGGADAVVWLGRRRGSDVIRRRTSCCGRGNSIRSPVIAWRRARPLGGR